jgi:hypothetical protein
MEENKEDKPWEKYIPVYNAVLIRFLTEHFFKKEFMKGYYVHEIVQDKQGDWIFRLKKEL